MRANTGVVGFGDADSFYASAEAVRRPWLAGLPVGVLGNQGACVIARNYPMKRFVVQVGEPVWEAKKKCPDGVYVKRDFKWYETLSRRMLDELRVRFSPKVEYPMGVERPDFGPTRMRGNRDKVADSPPTSDTDAD